MEEVPTRLEPCLLSDGMPPSVAERVLRIAEMSAKLGEGLRPITLEALSDGITTVEARRSLEMERIDPDCVDGEVLVADHVAAQSKLSGSSGAELVSRDFLLRAHSMLFPGRDLIRGEGQDVVVGRHFPPSGGRVGAFLDHYARRLVPATRSLAHVPAAHHRLAFVHPFVDGNGRLCRLHSQVLFSAVLGHRPLWSISRALSAEGTARYLTMMDMADMPRQGALDGRGNLSQKALGVFTDWFLEAVEKEVELSHARFSPAAIEAAYGSLALSKTSARTAALAARVYHGEAIEVSDEVDALLSAGLARIEAGTIRVSFPHAFLTGVLDILRI